jgi:hypothetical protein
VRRFVRGDIVALPAGWVMWILNNDTQQRFSMLGGARTDHLPHPAKWEVRVWKGITATKAKAKKKAKFDAGRGLNESLPPCQAGGLLKKSVAFSIESAFPCYATCGILPIGMQSDAPRTSTRQRVRFWFMLPFTAILLTGTSTSTRSSAFRWWNRPHPSNEGCENGLCGSQEFWGT